MAGARPKAALIDVGAWGRVLSKAAAQSAKIEFVCCVGRNPGYTIVQWGTCHA